MITITQKGKYEKIDSYLKKLLKIDRKTILNKYGEMGVLALSANTPQKTGRTANSWGYKIDDSPGKSTITFYNSNIQNGVPIAIILDYGHGTRNGGWVQGLKYIDKSIQPVFEKMSNEIWREVTSYERK